MHIITYYSLMSGLMTVSFWSHFGLISVFFVFFRQSAKNSAVLTKQVPPDYASQARLILLRMVIRLHMGYTAADNTIRMYKL